MSESSPRSPTRFILVRHGQAEGNRELRYLGVTDAPLTETGREQARRLVGAVRPFTLAAVISSPLVRARDTARTLADDRGLPVTLRDDLREMDFGVWENRTRAAVLAEYPDLLAAWETSAEVAPPGGETLAAVSTRIVGCANALAATYPGQTVALVTHVGPIKTFVCAALDLPPMGALRMWLDPASICVVDWRPGGAQTGGSGTLRLFYATGHLDPPSWVAR
ncbi:MAG TPA: histidine phosphatase family protein [Ktedonobacterales bacterium]|nr:histidine phosphatase family protein [Ktedonobacterales bacterium]